VKWVTRKRPKIDRLACPWLILPISLGLGANIADDQELLTAPLPLRALTGI
jgi:Chromate resistance exported protein